MKDTLELTPSAPSVVWEADQVSIALQKYVSQTGLEPTAQQTLAEAFRPVFVKAHAAIAASAGVAESVKDATCVREIKRSRDGRLAIRAVRIEGEKVHKAQKESALRFGRAVDGFRSILLAELAPVEEALENAEKTAELAEAARLAALKASREAELAPLLDGTPILADLSQLTEATFQKLIADHRLLRQAKIDATAKQEAERLAKIEEARIERERLDVENARLKAESERLESERKLLEEKAADEKIRADTELRRIEDERRAEQRAQEVERRRIEVAHQAERAKAEAEKQALEAKAREAARKAKAEAYRLKAELEAKERAEAKVKADEAARLEAERKAKEAAERRAAAAPDQAKLEALLELVNELQLPHLANKEVRDRVIAAHEVFASTLERLIVSLTAAPASKELP